MATAWISGVFSVHEDIYTGIVIYIVHIYFKVKVVKNKEKTLFNLNHNSLTFT